MSLLQNSLMTVFYVISAKSGDSEDSGPELLKYANIWIPDYYFRNDKTERMQVPLINTRKFTINLHFSINIV